MLNFVQVVLCALFLTVPALAEDASELSSPFSVGAGAGVTVFSKDAYEHHQTSATLTGAWRVSPHWGAAIGGDYFANNEGYWRKKQTTLSAHAHFHPFGSAPARKGFDPYMLAGGALLLSTDTDSYGYRYSEHSSRIDAGLGTDFHFPGHFAAWMDLAAGREITATKIHYGTSFTSHVGIKYFF